MPDEPLVYGVLRQSRMSALSMDQKWEPADQPSPSIRAAWQGTVGKNCEIELGWIPLSRCRPCPRRNRRTASP